jgi:predicted phosphate transport protein (TIGR00153 family)
MPFFPQEGQIFELFIELATTVNQASQQLSKIKIGSSTTKKIAHKVQQLELKGDEVTHLLKHEADKSFITPIDREDIHALANSLNVVLDHIENVTSGIYLLDIKANGHEFKTYTELIEESTQLVLELANDLAYKGKYINKMKVSIQTLHQLEKKGDELTRTALMNLFLHNKKPLVIIKWKHIYDNLEHILDACEVVADTYDAIIIKNF